jgi:hypothetical protein
MRAALAAGFGLGTPSAAEGPYAQRARISALGSAEKYAQAIPLAKAMLANLDKGPPTKDLAGALNNLMQLRDAEAEPRFKRALAIMERVPGLESVDSAIELNNLAALCQRDQRYAGTTVEAGAGALRALACGESSRHRSRAYQPRHHLREAGPRARDP